MNPRLAKEFRGLLFPWCVCALAGLGHLAERHQGGRVATFVIMMAAFGFFAGCLIVAATPFGSEFQQRTWPLVLGQPLERSQLWKEKFLAATVAVLALIAVHGAMVLVVGQKLPFDDMLPCVGFVVATICSAGFCALAARSVIGGMAFAACWQFVVMLVVSGALYACYKLFGRDPAAPDMEKWPVVTAYVCAGALYSAFTLWLGWRTFAEMEVRDAPASANLALPDWMTPKKLATILRCQPAGNLRNLIRKEAGLQKPIFTIATVFVACWVVAFLLLLLEPSRRVIYVGTLNALTAIHIAIIALLAGCVSLGDEKSLGVTAWHLTLPVSSRRQWFVKLLVSAATAILVGLVLPLFLSALTLIKARVGLFAVINTDTSTIVFAIVPMSVLVVLGFWCASFLENTVRAVLTLVLACAVLGTAASLAVWIADKFGGLQTGFLTSLIARFQWSPYSLDGVFPWGGIYLCLVAGATLIALVQSFSQFRRAQSQSAALFRHGAILAAVVFAIAFWVADFNVSMNNQRNQRFSSALVPEITTALRSVTLQDSELPEGQVGTLTLRALENSNPLSDRAKLWLRNSTIDVHWVNSRSKHFANLRVYIGEVHLPKGAIVPFSWTVPDLPQAQPPKEKP